MEIPRRSPPEVPLVHKQVAIRFGKTFSADIPSYRKLVEKVEAGSFGCDLQPRTSQFGQP